MKFLLVVLSVILLLAPAGVTSAADDSKVKAATQQVETGAKKIGDGQVGTGVEQTAKGIGHTVAEGAFTAPVLAELARRHGVAMPIVDAVCRLLVGASARAVATELLARPLVAEGTAA